MLSLLKKLFHRRPKPLRLEIRLVSYTEAETLLAQGWTIAKEEDTNQCIGHVYLERLEAAHCPASSISRDFTLEIARHARDLLTELEIYDKVFFDKNNGALLLYRVKELLGENV